MSGENTIWNSADPYGVPTGSVPPRALTEEEAERYRTYVRQFKSEKARADRKQVGGESYVSLSVQPWDALESWMTKDQITGYHLGCIVTYLARYNSKADGKGGKQDLLKAQHYLDKLLEVVG